MLRLLRVQSLAGGAIAMAYVSTALNKMDNSAEGQQESLARTKKTGYLNDSAAQERVNRIMKTLEATPSVSVLMLYMQILMEGVQCVCHTWSRYVH